MASENISYPIQNEVPYWIATLVGAWAGFYARGTTNQEGALPHGHSGVGMGASKWHCFDNPQIPCRNEWARVEVRQVAML